MIYLFLVLLLITLSYFVGWGALVIVAHFGPSETIGLNAGMITTGCGVAIFVGLLVWAVLDKGKRSEK